MSLISWDGSTVEHGHLLGAIAKGDVAIGHIGHRVLLVHREVGRMELGKGPRPLWVNPAHAGAKLANCVDGELHESERSLTLNTTLGTAGDADGHQAAGNLFDGRNAQAAKVRGTNLGEQTLH